MGLWVVERVVWQKNYAGYTGPPNHLDTFLCPFQKVILPKSATNVHLAKILIPELSGYFR